MRFKAAPETDEQLSLIEKGASLTTPTETLVDQMEQSRVKSCSNFAERRG